MGNDRLVKRICIVPNVSGVGGMVSFRAKLEKGLEQRGIGVSKDLKDTPYDVILVIGGTRDLPGLWRAKKRGIRIIQRLDGINWIHRCRRTGVRHYLRAEYGNIILSSIRARLADKIVYQSEFSRRWWERVYGADKTPWQVVFNGVDLNHFTPAGAGRPPGTRVRLLLVEGSIGGGYEWGLETGVRMAERLLSRYGHATEMVVVGRINDSLKQRWMGKADVQLSFSGQVAHEKIPELDRSAHLLYAADINAACPNSVIEALACGLPVVAFNTGALPELVTTGSGKLVPYGGDPWKLDPPDINALADAANAIIQNLAGFKISARRRAEAAFSLEKMVSSYLEALSL